MAHRTLVVLLLVLAVGYMDRQLVAILIEPIKLELGMTDAAAGLLYKKYGAHSLRAALLIVPPLFLWAAVHYEIAARRLAADLGQSEADAAAEPTDPSLAPAGASLR